MPDDTSSFDSAKLLELLEVSRHLAATTDLKQLLEAVIDAGRSVLSAERGSVFLCDTSKGELYSTVATGEKQIRVPMDQGIVGQCATCKQVISVPDAYADTRFNQDVDRRTGFRTDNLLAVPLLGIEGQLVGVLQLLNAAAGCFTEGDQRIAQVLGSQAAVAIQRALLMEERIVKLKLEQDLEIARRIQQHALPVQLPACPGYDLAAYCQPADATGGDIYDVAALCPRGGDEATALLLLLADATGHGVGPALSVSQARAMLRLGLRLGGSLGELYDQINRQLLADLPEARFVTAFIGLLDPVTHSVDYRAAGQGPLLHYHAEASECEWRGASGPPLGIVADAPRDPPPPFVMAPGDLLVLLTDGLFEYANRSGDQFGKSRVGQIVQREARASAQHVLDVLLAEIRAFAGAAPQADDMTAVILKRQPALDHR